MENYVGALITFLVGLVALLVYQKQKRDYKKDAANILIIEIESAERQLQIIQEGVAPKSLKENQFLMPSASWSKYRHLFARDLTHREWDIVTDFYNRCNQFDEAVKYNSTFFRQDVEAYRISLNQVLAQEALAIAKKIKDLNENDEDKEFEKHEKLYLDHAAKTIKLYMEPKNLYAYDPQKPVNDALAAVSNIDSHLSTSTIGVKLRRIARPSLFMRLFSRKLDN